MGFKNKHVLITAGPTWVPIDSVRVISNIASGETGILLAEKLQRRGAQVTLLLGPVQACCLDKKIKLVRFRFFEEFKKAVLQELRSKKYDALIHSAAVCDYQPEKVYLGKVKSGRQHWKLDLTPTVKIIDLIRKTDRSLFLAGFKFQPRAEKNTLIKEARGLMRRADLDLVVANTISGKRYLAYILEQKKIYGSFFNKNALAENLTKIIGR
ncbi:MAG: phosphopantothenoylcysteine decarboxylase [Candidatus Omnitrophica bacterium]|nr:phosphopantothenoylcysteine decarboxylase [Candidatus Omnitrophota bacterium]